MVDTGPLLRGGEGWCSPAQRERVDVLHVISEMTDKVAGWKDHPAYWDDVAWFRRVLAPALEGRLAQAAQEALHAWMTFDRVRG